MIKKEFFLFFFILFLVFCVTIFQNKHKIKTKSGSKRPFY